MIDHAFKKAAKERREFEELGMSRHTRSSGKCWTFSLFRKKAVTSFIILSPISERKQ